MSGRRGGPPRVGLLWRGDPADPNPQPRSTRFARIFEEFAARGALAEPVIYSDRIADEVGDRLAGMHAVLVWVDPIVWGEDRVILDSVLRTAASSDTYVSAHPDVILAMGTKQVLYRTRDMEWGTDTRLYRDEDELVAGLRDVGPSASPRVLKQNRGSGGNGVWKVERTTQTGASDDPVLRVQHGARGALVEEILLGEFVLRCREYFGAFEGTGRIVDQPYCDRLSEGMVRCYLSYDRVVGFGHQYVTALTAPAPGAAGPPDPPPRLYYPPSKPDFQRLKGLMEGGWVTEMCRRVGIDRSALPVIWDADFLYGPKDSAGQDSYILCEINVSGVFPIPDESVAPLVSATIERVEGSRRQAN